MFEKMKGYVQYAAKALVAAAAPIVMELIDNLVVEMSNAVQGMSSAVLAAVAVYVTRNAPSP